MISRLCLLVSLCFAPALALGADAPRQFTGAIEMVDGDTLRVGGSPNLRLLGIDAPEHDQTCETTQGRVFDCGAWVTRTVQAALDGRSARCETTRSDRYDRPLVTCRIGGADLGALLVREGLARTYRDTPTYAAEEKTAALSGRGLWAYRMDDPAAHRRAGRVPATTSAPDPDCVIKGNISSNGRIYHKPGNEHYARTVIDPSRGERWFCSEAQARAAGWRAARR